MPQRSFFLENLGQQFFFRDLLTFRSAIQLRMLERVAYSLLFERVAYSFVCDFIKASSQLWFDWQAQPGFPFNIYDFLAIPLGSIGGSIEQRPNKFS